MKNQPRALKKYVTLSSAEISFQGKFDVIIFSD